MLIKTLQVCDSTAPFNQESIPLRKSELLVHRNSVIFRSKDEPGFRNLRSHGLLHEHEKRRRNIIVYSVDPGSSPSGPPPNILGWIAGVAIAIVIPLITKKWGPLLKSKIVVALQTAEDVVEAVEKVAEKVEEVAEDIADDLPPTAGKLKEAIDRVEKFAERAADEAGAIDDFIDKVQEDEKRAESLAESIKDDLEKPPEDLKEEKPNNGNQN